MAQLYSTHATQVSLVLILFLNVMNNGLNLINLVEQHLKKF